MTKRSISKGSHITTGFEKTMCFDAILNAEMKAAD